jgi:alpha-beta hydrolase superfamily lysophospholipase
MTKKIIEFIQLDGHRLAFYQWKITAPNYLVMLLHGYGEHLARYEALAKQLNCDGAQVFGVD